MRIRVVGMRAAFVSLSLLIAIPVLSTGQHPSTGKTQPNEMAIEPSAKGSDQDPGTTRTLVDINGRPVTLGRDETYLAELSLQDGRIVIFRQNKADVAALVAVVKTTKEAQARMATKEFWRTIQCTFDSHGGCLGGCSHGDKCKRQQNAAITRFVLPPVNIKKFSVPWFFCACQ